MKRLIGLLTAGLLCFSMGNVACAIQTDYIKPMTMDAFSDYTQQTSPYKLTMSAAAYGDGVAFNGQGIDWLWFSEESDGNIALSFPAVSDKIYRVQSSVGATGTAVASVRVKPLGSYETITIQFTDTTGQPLASLRFQPKSSGSTVAYSDGELGTSEYPTSVDVAYDALPLHEWTTVQLTADIVARTYSASVTNALTGTNNIITDTKFRYYNDPAKGANLARIQFAMNRSQTPWYTNGALFDDFHIYINDPIVSISDMTAETEVGSDYTLPTVVPVVLESGAEHLAAVDWNGSVADTATVGTASYTGTVTDSDGTQFPVTLTLEVKPLAIAEIAPIQVYLGRNTGESMPQKVKVKYSGGNYAYETVSWNTPLDETLAMQTVTGTVAGYDGDVVATVCFYDTNTPVLDMDLSQYREGYILRNAPWTLKTEPQIVASEFPLDSGNMAMRYADTAGYACITTNTKAGAVGNSVVVYDLYLPETLVNFVVEILDEGYSRELTEVYFRANGTIVVDTAQYPNAFPLGEWFQVKQIADEYSGTYSLFINNVLIADNLLYKNSGSLAIIRFNDQDSSNPDFVAYADNIKLYALSDMLSASYDEMSFYNTNITGNFTLPHPSDAQTSVIWTSDKPAIAVSGNTATVTRPVYGNADETVTLTAELCKNIGAFSVKSRKNIPLTVKAAEPTPQEAVTLALNGLTLSDLTEETATNITKDITLPQSADYGVTYTWSSSEPTVITPKGVVYVADTDKTVTLTVTASCNQYTDTKAFTLTVPAQAVLSDLQAIRRVMQTLTLPASVSSNLTLPASGAEGVSISWTSDNLTALSNSGAYLAPATMQTVTMTAILTKGDARDTKAFTITVQPTRIVGGGFGGSGGGGGGGGGSFVAPVVTPSQTETNQTPQEIYSDIEAYPWAKEAISQLTRKGILNGTGNGEFQPQRTVLREEFVAMAVRAFQYDVAPVTIPFADISENAWYYEVCSTAYHNGIINGISAEAFGVGRQITRQDMMVILYQAAQKKGISLDKVREMTAFEDMAHVADYATEAVEALYTAGIVNGDGTSLYPQSSATRAEAAKILYELTKLVK